MIDQQCHHYTVTVIVTYVKHTHEVTVGVAHTNNPNNPIWSTGQHHTPAVALASVHIKQQQLQQALIRNTMLGREWE